MFLVDPKTSFRCRTPFSGVVSLKAVNTLVTSVNRDIREGVALYIISEWIDTVSYVVTKACELGHIDRDEETRLLRDAVLPARDLVFAARQRGEC